MTTIIRARTAAEFLGLIPRLAGYRPRRSLVLVPFRGSRTAGLLRLDLPEVDDDAFAATAIGTVCRVPQVDGVAIVVYHDSPDACTAQTGLVQSLAARAHACGLMLGEALWVAGSRWGSFLDDALHGVVAAPTASLAAAAVPSDQAAAATLPAVTEGTRRDVADAITAVERVVDASRGRGHGVRGDVAGLDPRAVAVLERLDDLGELWDRVVRADACATAEPFELAVLLWALQDPAVRDAALAVWCTGRHAAIAALTASRRWSPGDPVPEANRFLLGEGPRPDPRRLIAAREGVRLLAAVGEGRYRAGALAAAAWLSWALGAGTHADRYARESLLLHPDDATARLVQAYQSFGHLPPWAFTRTAPAEPDGHDAA